VKVLTIEERKCYTLVMKVMQATLVQYGAVRLDCGCMLDKKTYKEWIDKGGIQLIEQEDGQFLALCPDCLKGGMDETR